MPDFSEIVDAWRTVADDAELRRPAIHPTGTDASVYAESGLALAQRVFELAPPERYRTIGDFGCGDGRVVQWLTGYERVVGADASAAMIAALEADVQGVQGVLSTGVDGKLPKLDCWYTCAVFIHHSYADGVELLSALAEATQPGGRILLDVPVYDVARERSAWNDVTCWDRQQLHDAARLAGLRVVQLEADSGSFSFQSIGPRHGAFTVLDNVAA